MTATMNEPATLGVSDRLNGKRFAAILKAVAACAATEKMRFALRAVRVEPREAGGFEVIATDGRILAQVTCEPAYDFPSLTRAVLVDVDALKRVRASDSIVPDGDKLAHYDGKGSRVGTLAEQEGTFPNWRDILPGRTGETNTSGIRRPDAPAKSAAGFDPARLVQLLGCASAVLGDGHAVVESWVPGDKATGPARWDGRTSDAEFVGVIMPMSLE